MGPAALAASDVFTPVAAPQMVSDLILYPGAARLVEPKQKAKVDASVTKIFGAFNIKCSSIEEIFWSTKTPQEKVLTGFKVQMDKLKYTYEVVQRIKTGSVIKINAGKQQLHGLWDYSAKTTMLALCK
ncbi:hypothetical protein GCM10008938_11020 [Deinococcus roseus]|uniref:Uncharacterized protein n=1 Tax=Deinococcus roseus TaxID=392414 RepID=A0ABQ2CW32_9DEIO|nr:hypothetical protein GCM10008938_11020 [Deinococcus roseus]